MAKVGDINQSEYGKILSDHVSSFYRNSSAQDFENSFKKGGVIDDIIKTLEGRLQNHQKVFLQYQADLLNIQNSYQEQDNRIFGSREALDAEINRNQKDSYELNKILTGLKTLSNVVLENKQDMQKSIDQFRSSVSAVQEIQPNVFKRALTFFKNLFTDNQKQLQNIASEGLKSFMTNTFVKSDEIKALMYAKVANFIANNPERMKEAQEKMGGSKNMNPNIPPIPNTPPPPLPPEVEARMREQANQTIQQASNDRTTLAPNRLPPLTPPELEALKQAQTNQTIQQASNDRTTLPPNRPPPLTPPEIEKFKQQQANANKVQIPNTPPPPLPAEKQTPLDKTFEVPPPSDIPPPPNIAGKSEIAPKNLESDLRNIAAKFGIDTKGRVADDWGVDEVSTDKGAKVPSAPPPPPAGKSSEENIKDQATKVLPQNASDVEEDKETTKEVTKSPESFDKLKEDIKKGVRLRNSQDKTNPLDHEGFKYTEIQKSTNQLELMFGKEYEVDKLLADKPKDQQMNVLYSAVVQGLTAVVKELVDRTVQVDTGKTMEDDWGDKRSVMETQQLFSKEDVQKVYSAAKSLITGKEGVSHAQKVKIEKSVEDLSKKIGIEAEGKGRA